MNNYEITYYAIIVSYNALLVYMTYIIYNVIDVLRTIAFMVLERNCPLNHDRFCRFLSSHVIPFTLSFFLFRHSRDLSTLESSTVGSQKSTGGKRGMSKRFPRVPANNLFVARSGQKRTQFGERDGLPFCVLLSDGLLLDILRRAET